MTNAIVSRIFSLEILQTPFYTHFSRLEIRALDGVPNICTELESLENAEIQ